MLDPFKRAAVVAVGVERIAERAAESARIRPVKRPPGPAVRVRVEWRHCVAQAAHLQQPTHLSVSWLAWDRVGLRRVNGRQPGRTGRPPTAQTSLLQPGSHADYNTVLFLTQSNCHAGCVATRGACCRYINQGTGSCVYSSRRGVGPRHHKQARSHLTSSYLRERHGEHVQFSPQSPMTSSYVTPGSAERPQQQVCCSACMTST